VLAQDAPSDAEFDVNRDTITAGVAGVYLTDYEGSNDYRWVPAPAATGSIKGYGFTLAGNRLSVDLIRNQPGPTWDLQAGPIGVVNFNRSNSKSIDDRRVRALGEVDTAIELGGYVGIGKTGVITSPYDSLSVTVSYRHDVAGAHDSAIWQPSINYLTPLSTKAAVAFFGSAERAGRGYATTYFSVSPTQTIASGLPTYNARGGWKNYTLGGLATYSLTGNLLHGVKLVAGGTYRRMLNDFADSPLTSVAGSKDQWLGAVGLAYTF
jgi:outer membrane protein